MLSPTPPIDRSSLRPGTGYLIAPRVPHGLATVVEGLAREVLRHRPEDIYVFAARHFEKLLKLREEYSSREFSHEFGGDFNLWPTKEKQNGKLSNGGLFLEREIEIFERREKVSADTEESQEDVSADGENQRARQTCSRDRHPATSKKTSKRSKDNETTSNARATRIISQMTALHGPGKNIQTKDIKQELRRNKLSGEKSKATDSVEKGIRGDRRSRTRVPKTDRGSVEEAERTTTTTTTTSSSRTARRPLKKVRRIETESETETERDIAAKAEFQDGYARSSIRNDGVSREGIARTGSREKRPEAWLSEHSFERKVSSRALSMDRIRAYVLRKFASTASLEVLRSPTYVEQVQEVIDRAAPIIKEKLEEIGRPRGKRSRSVDLAWNGESHRRHVREEKRYGDKEKSGRGRNGAERKADVLKKEKIEDFLGDDESISTVEKEEKKPRRRSAGSGKRSRKRENGDFGFVDQVDDNSKHSNKLEHESDATRDTLEARLTATQSILEDISRSTSELGGARKSDLTGNEPSESEVSDHINVVSLPVVRPPSSRNSRSATKNGSDSLTLPPISPEAPKSTKKKDELSLPILPTVASSGNHSTEWKPQEQDISKEAEEASTMHDITSDIEDIAALPENGHENVIVDETQDLGSDRQDLLPNARFSNEEEYGIDEDMYKVFGDKRESLEEFEKLEKLEEGRRSEEVFRDSLNVTPEVADLPFRPDSLESDGNEVKLQDDNVDPAGENMFDKLKDKLIEIEMAERSIEKALACQQVATYDISEMTSQAEKSMTDGKINEAGEPTNEAEETMSEIPKSTDAGKIPINKEGVKRKGHADEKAKTTNDMSDMEVVKDVAQMSSKMDLNIEEKLTKKSAKMVSEMKRSTKERTNGIGKSTNKNEAEKLNNKVKILKNEKIADRKEVTTKATENMMKAQDEKSVDKVEKLINEKMSNGVEEELAVKVHVEHLQSVSPSSRDEDSQVTEVVETDGDNIMTSKKKTENTTKGSSRSTTIGNAAIKSERSNLPNENGKTKARKKRESDKLPVMTPLSLELPYSYVLSEGSPCEIPDSVTTVIIPDRPCVSPVTMEDYQFESTNGREESYTRLDMTKEISIDERQEKDQHRYSMEVFGEYVRPETAVLPVDTDFVRRAKGTKPSQDIVIIHQDLDKIKEEGEEEEEKEDHQEKKNDKEKSVKEEEIKMPATLEDIVEHEENEETDVKMIETKDAEKISSFDVLEYESLPDTKELTIDTNLTNEGRAESRSLPENSSEESGSTQGTTTSSDVKESTTSNQSIESPSLSRPVVPELNLDSLQDNTVSSFKMTANGTEKDNGSLRESDATISLVEPLLSDERLINRLAEREEEIVAEELTERDLQSEVPEADQLYRAEHAEYEWLGKDPLSTEINLEDEMESQKNSIDLKTLPGDSVQVDPQEKAEAEELGSEEEIARELIGSLDEDMQICAEEMDFKKESVDSGVSEKSNLETDDKFSQHPLSASTILVDREKRECEDSLNKINEVVKIETTSELSDNVTDVSYQEKGKDNTTIDKESEKIKLEMTEEAHVQNSQVAPLAEFEQDELLEENGRPETTDKNLTIKSKPDIIDADIQERCKDERTSIEEALDQSSDIKIGELNKKLEENKQEELQSQKKIEQEKLEVHENRDQEKLDDREEIEQDKLKIQGEDNQESEKMEKKIVSTTTLPLEMTESRKDSINESMKNDDEHEKTEPSNESVVDDQTGKDEENEKKEKSKGLSKKVESVHGPITSAISKHSMEDHSRFGHWTTEMKSSTVETVIDAYDSNTSTDEKMEIVSDAPEIMANESLIQKKDDFYSAVMKIQACVRGFLARRRVRRDLKPQFVSDIVPLTQKMVTSDRLVIPQDISNLREARRLRREEALRNTTLSLENAFASGRLQHTGEFHDSVPLLPFDLANSQTDSVTSSDSLDEEIDVKEDNPPDIAKPSADASDPVRDNVHGTSFHKGNAFVDPTFPIVMHLLTGAAPRNCHFTVRQNSHSDLNASAGGAKTVEPTVDILMLGYPRNDENQYLNFITSVEDLTSNADSLTLDDMMRSVKNARPSTISDEGSLREPLALPGVSQGVMIEEVTSLDEPVPSESTKPSTPPKTSSDTNSSMPSEECVLEDKRNDLGMFPRATNAAGERKQGAEGQESDRNLENVGESVLLSEDANKKI